MNLKVLRSTIIADELSFFATFTFFRRIDTGEVNTGIFRLINREDIIFTGQNGIQHNTQNSSQRNTRQSNCDGGDVES